MAKKKKEIEKGTPKKKEEKFIELTNFRITKADPLNWGVDEKNDKGEWKGISSRSYYPTLSILLIAVLEKSILKDSEAKSLKKLKKELSKAKDELKTIVKDLVKASQ